MLIVFTGNGKGKTTAALGQVVRVLGREKRALMIQFIKGPWVSGEDEFVNKLQKHKGKLQEALAGVENIYDFEIKKMGLGFVGILGDQLPREEHEKAALSAVRYFEEALAKTGAQKFDLIVLDEINVAISLNLIKVEDVLPVLKKIPDNVLVLLTGRDAPQEFIDAADLATEMREMKHPFTKGKMGKLNVEF
jgi:cob(I)alamin adenosyltransferase